LPDGEARTKRGTPDWNKLLFERVLSNKRHGGGDRKPRSVNSTSRTAGRQVPDC
jgi:hypothetical protein